MKYKNNNFLGDLLDMNAYRFISLIVGIIILFQGSTNLLPQFSIGTINISTVDLLALLGVLLFILKSVFFHIYIIVLSMFFIADNISIQSYLRDLTPILYIGYIFFGLHLNSQTTLKILKIFTYIIFLISCYYLVASYNSWYRFSALTDAEAIIIFIITYRNIISKQKIFIELKTNTKLYNILLIIIAAAQVVNGSRTITIIMAIIVIYQLIKNYNLLQILLRLTLLLSLTILTLSLLRPLAIIRIADLISGQNNAMGSITISYRETNFSYLWNNILNHPFFGNGFGKYHTFELGLEFSSQNPAWIVHNDYIALLYYYGFIGLFIVLAIFVYGLRSNYMIRSEYYSQKNILFLAFALLATNTPLIGNDSTGPLFWFFIGSILVKKSKLSHKI